MPWLEDRLGRVILTFRTTGDKPDQRKAPKEFNLDEGTCHRTRRGAVAKRRARTKFIKWNRCDDQQVHKCNECCDASPKYSTEEQDDAATSQEMGGGRICPPATT